MRKANEASSVLIAQFIEMSPNQLEQLLTRFKAAMVQASPGEAATIEIASGIYLYHDPKVLRGDMERRNHLRPTVEVIRQSGNA